MFFVFLRALMLISLFRTSLSRFRASLLFQAHIFSSFVVPKKFFRYFVSLLQNEVAGMDCVYFTPPQTPLVGNTLVCQCDVMIKLHQYLTLRR
ncbi:hypothetical protein P3L10_001969 [Capsicum annuum]